MIVALTLALAVIAFAAAFHLHWALGGKLGLAVSLPQRADDQPVLAHLFALWRAAALCVALGLVVLAVLALAQTKVLTLGLNAQWVRGALMLVGVAFIARALAWGRYVGLFKTLRTTRWARYDTRLYSPLFLILGASLLFLTSL